MTGPNTTSQSPECIACRGSGILRKPCSIPEHGNCATYSSEPCPECSHKPADIVPDLARGTRDSHAPAVFIRQADMPELLDGGSVPAFGTIEDATDLAAWRYVPERALLESQAALAAANARADRAEAKRWVQCTTLSNECLGGCASLKEHDRYRNQQLRADLAQATKDRDDLTSMLVKLFDWSDTSYIHAVMHVENAVRNLRADLAVERADLARVTAERDEATARASVVGRQIQINLQNHRDDLATARESVRELVDGLRAAQEAVLLWSADPNREPGDKWRPLSARWQVAKIDALLAKHAAPAPTPARSPLDPPEKIGAEDMENPRPPKGTILDVNGKPTPAAVPGLEFEAFPLNGLVCAECRTPQRDTPHGASCENGHGGADGIDVAKAVT